MLSQEERCNISIMHQLLVIVTRLKGDRIMVMDKWV